MVELGFKIYLSELFHNLEEKKIKYFYKLKLIYI